MKYAPDVYASKDSLDALGINTNGLSSALLDAYDIRNALSKRIKNQPKDSEGTDTTIGDCLDSIIEFLEALESEIGESK